MLVVSECMTNMHVRLDKNSRECPDALCGVSNVPDFDVGGGDCEHQTRAVTHRYHVVGVAT